MVASVRVRSTLGQWVACTYSVWLRSSTRPILPLMAADYLEWCPHCPEIPEEDATGVFPLYI